MVVKWLAEDLCKLKMRPKKNVFIVTNGCTLVNRFYGIDNNTNLWTIPVLAQYSKLIEGLCFTTAILELKIHPL